MPRKAGRVRRGTVGVDRTSDLPVLVLDLILSYIPLREIVRTSILSTDWRYSWATAPKLVFDKSCCSASWKSRIIDESEALARIIDHVLLLHMGSIEVLKIRDIRAVPDIDRCLLHVCRQPIKELVLEVCGHEEYRSPSSLYRCKCTVKLMLLNCILSPPSSFKGFKWLKRLFLVRCTLNPDTFANLISSCPLLGELALIQIDGLEDVKIDGAQNLQCVDIRGTFKSLTFGCKMPKLSDAVIRMVERVNYGPAYVESGLTDFLNKLPSIQRLEMRYWFFKHLAVGSIPESMPFQLKDLYHLSISVDFCVPNECLAALCLLNSPPNLTELVTESWEYVVMGRAPSTFLDGVKCCCRFEKLRRVRMNSFGVRTGQLVFMELVLANSPVLEKMTIVPIIVDDVGLIVKDVVGFKRLSPAAEIIFE